MTHSGSRPEAATDRHLSRSPRLRSGLATTVAEHRKHRLRAVESYPAQVRTTPRGSRDGFTGGPRREAGSSNRVQMREPPVTGRLPAGAGARVYRRSTAARRSTPTKTAERVGNCARERGERANWGEPRERRTRGRLTSRPARVCSCGRRRTTPPLPPRLRSWRTGAAACSRTRSCPPARARNCRIRSRP